MLASSKQRAKLLGLPHNISLEDIQIPEICPVFKVPLVYKTEFTSSLDRIDSFKGYIKGNVQVISWKANTMKNSATKEELLKFAEWVLNTEE